MSSRRYPTAELYEERQRDFYRGGGNRSERSYAELDEELSRSDYRAGRTPDFLREDYGRTAAGPLVLRDRVSSDDFDRRSHRGGGREVEEEKLVIRDRRDSARPREQHMDRHEVVYHRDETTRRPRETEETDIVVRRRESSRPPPPRSREVEREEIDIRRETRESRPREVSRETREIEREDIRFRRGSGRPAREVEKEEIVIRREEHEGRRRQRSVEKEEIVIRREEHEGRRRQRSVERERETMIIRPRERSLPPPQLVAREREDFVIRRRRSISPAGPVEKKEEIIIRRTEREPTPSPPPPIPEPAPIEPIVRPPIIQEVITHHRHIDHGIERARSPSPPPPPPSPPKEESLEIAIRRRATDGHFDEDIIYERETTERRSHRENHREKDLQISRRRSLSAPRRRYDDDIESEADFYNRKVAERAYVGEGYNGATQDWAIVDVPPGTKRVQMDGAGGGRQEITWQRYNGVRRSKFMTDDGVYGGDFGAPVPAPVRKKTDMWTEITKDLVLKDAIDRMGYQYEETDFFFYVMEYLKYEDVLRLVEVSDDIRRERRTRIREIQWEREELDRPQRRPAEERIYEREYIHEHDYSRRGGRYR